MPVFSRLRTVLTKSLYIVVITLSIALAGGSAAASDFMVPVKSIAQINVDDDNRPINYPVAVFFDPVTEETYVINGGRNRVVVYGPDFFPRVSFGNGRGVITPRGGTIMDNGEVYICQVKSAKNPRSRITILNGAFFVEREIFIDEIPEVEDFKPRNLAMNNEGIIYLAGDNYRGVLVLDNEGNFLRWLQPMDQIILRGEEAATSLDQGGNQEGEGELLPGDAEDTEPVEDPYADIPEEFRPRSSLGDTSGIREVQGPVKINFVTIDSTGRIYLISAETGRIYVYGPDESFLFAFGTKGGSPGQQSNPRSLVIDEEVGVIYVVDYMRHTILAYNMKGEYIFEFGGRGFNPGWFNFPTDLAINNQGQLIVADLFNRRVQVLEVGKEGISYYMNPSSIEADEETPDSMESLESDEMSPGQPEDTLEENIESDATLEELYETIKEEKSSLEEEIIIEEESGYEDKIITEEEVIEETPPVGQPEPPGPFDEPLVTPE